jgi:hypothetical protein
MKLGHKFVEGRRMGYMLVVMGANEGPPGGNVTLRPGGRRQKTKLGEIPAEVTVGLRAVRQLQRVRNKRLSEFRPQNLLAIILILADPYWLMAA